jgi:hypothetical protein
MNLQNWGDRPAGALKIEFRGGRLPVWRAGEEEQPPARHPQPLERSRPTILRFNSHAPRAITHD